MPSAANAFTTLVPRLMAAAACLILVSVASASAVPLKIGGTGAALGGMTLLAEAFKERHPETEVEIVTGLGSTGGVKAVLAGAIDIGVAARGLRDKEREAGVVAEAYARTPFVLATNTENRADNITLERLAEIHRGEFAKWPDGSLIRLVLRPKADSDTAMLKQQLATMSAYAAELGGGHVVITGHADRSGSDTYNQELSLRRANEVAAAILACGFNFDNVDITHKGESQPVVDTSDGVPEPRNRRVEIAIKPS